MLKKIALPVVLVSSAVGFAYLQSRKSDLPGRPLASSAQSGAVHSGSDNGSAFDQSPEVINSLSDSLKLAKGEAITGSIEEVFVKAGQYTRRKDFNKAFSEIEKLVAKINAGIDIVGSFEKNCSYLNMDENNQYSRDLELTLGSNIDREFLNEKILKNANDLLTKGDSNGARDWMRAAIAVRLTQAYMRWHNARALTRTNCFKKLKEIYPDIFVEVEREISKEADLYAAFNKRSTDFLMDADEMIRTDDEKIKEALIDKVLEDLKSCWPPPAGQPECLHELGKGIFQLVTILKHRNRNDVVGKIKAMTQSWEELTQNEDQKRWLKEIYLFTAKPRNKLIAYYKQSQDGSMNEVNSFK